MFCWPAGQRRWGRHLASARAAVSSGRASCLTISAAAAIRPGMATIVKISPKVRLPTRELGHEKGAGNATEAARAQHPGHAGRAPLRRVKAGGQRR